MRGTGLIQLAMSSIRGKTRDRDTDRLVYQVWWGTFSKEPRLDISIFSKPLWGSSPRKVVWLTQGAALL